MCSVQQDVAIWVLACLLSMIIMRQIIEYLISDPEESSPV